MAKLRALFRSLLAAVGLVAVSGMAGRAQTITVQVVEDVAGAPIPGALISIAPAGEAFGEERMADESGIRIFTVPRAGEYTIRVRRIGFAATTQRVALTAQTGTQTATVRVAPVSIVLPAVAVTATGCERRGEDAAHLAVVHDEVSKSLISAKLSAQQARERTMALRFRRELGNDGRQRTGESTYVQVNAARPYVARSTAALLRDGFVVSDEDGWRFYGPDPELLLSEQFLQTHCFYLTQGTGRQSGRIGLAFEPVRGRTDPGIAGTLWVDRATSELREAEYRYVNLPRQVRSRSAGGHLRFGRLASGRWRIEEWVIRMPLMALSLSRTWIVVGHAEEGARLVNDSDAARPDF